MIATQFMQNKKHFVVCETTERSFNLNKLNLKINLKCDDDSVTSWSTPMNHLIYDGNFLSLSCHVTILRYEIVWEGALVTFEFSVAIFTRSKNISWTSWRSFHSWKLWLKLSETFLMFSMKRHRPHLVLFHYLFSRNVWNCDVTISTFKRKFSSLFKLNLFWWFTDDGNHHFFNIFLFVFFAFLPSKFQHSTK